MPGTLAAGGTVLSLYHNSLRSLAYVRILCVALFVVFILLKFLANPTSLRFSNPPLLFLFYALPQAAHSGVSQFQAGLSHKSDHAAPIWLLHPAPFLLLCAQQLSARSRIVPVSIRATRALLPLCYCNRCPVPLRSGPA